ncbi:hypothetical protein BJ741DRAFT_198895 [Chytriomyces cf. hyalinus JEL632]|nr:hypothetical protein BJ741DRAFT_198895 [Chytriomyces cf. hyalinus JEL632]
MNGSNTFSTSLNRIRQPVWYLLLSFETGAVYTTHLCQAAATCRGRLPEHLVSNQARKPAELKHINKRRKRNQQGFP